MSELEKIKEAILSVKKENVQSGNNHYPLACVSGIDISDKQWKGISSYASCKKEDVTVLIDNTISENGKKGAVFTADALYVSKGQFGMIPRKYRERFEPLRYADIREVKWNENDTGTLVVVFDDTEIEVFAGVFAKYYFLVLKAILSGMCNLNQTENSACVWTSRDWPDIVSQNQKGYKMPRDAFCRSYETTDVGTLLIFKKLEDEPFADRTLSFYWLEAEKGNAYAMYMYSENQLEVKERMKYLCKAAEMDYPPALYEYGRHMLSIDPESGYYLIERAAARGWGEAACYLILHVEKYANLSLEKILRYAEEGFACNDYNGVFAYATIADRMGDEEYITYYKIAAEMGHIESAKRLAEAYCQIRQYGEEYRWNEIVIKNSRRQEESVDDTIPASMIIALAMGRGVEKDEYEAFRKLIEALNYEYNDSNEELLQYLEMYNPEVRDLLVHMAQLTQENDPLASKLWKEFENVCSGPRVNSPRNIRNYMN